LGSQTIGSVARPAAFCGIVGVKPSYERVSAEGVFPVAPSVDTPGYFTQDVSGAQLAAGVVYTDWRANDNPTKNCTIGAVEGPYLSQASDDAQHHFKSHLEELTEAGYDVRRLQLFDNIEEINSRHQRLVAAEMTLSHDELYPQFGHQYAAGTVSLIEEGQTVSIEELAVARVGRKVLRKRIHKAMDEHAVDVIVSPSARGPAPEGIDTTGDPIMNLPWTHAGVPTVTLPASQTDSGLPMGLQCAGHYGRDEWLLSWCEDIVAALNN
jgi:Asp-tRNA(Asn)/Glu-tRNA(Gln) amidotransferase A subunit family amidase